jgi:hypothetical protein
MPVPPQQIPNQVLPSGQQPYVQQQNFGQMVGEVLASNPDMDPESIKVKLNGIVRKIYDRRTWYGCMVRGQIVTSGYTIGGSVDITNGSTTVQGVGTSWTPQLIGRQFRLGYNTPPYTITALDPAAQVITLEMPWGGASYTGAGYFIAQYYYSPGPNIKYIHTAKNLIMAWRLQLGYNQQSLDAIDPWRINTFSPTTLAQMPPGVNGEYMVELWPVPSIVQALPFIAVVQPPNLVNDNETLPAYIRTDVVTKFGIADAKVWRGPKLNKYYDMVESQRLRSEAENELMYLAKTDEDLYRQNLLYEWEQMRMSPEPSSAGFSINRGVAANGWNGNWDW